MTNSDLYLVASPLIASVVLAGFGALLTWGITKRHPKRPKRPSIDAPTESSLLTEREHSLLRIITAIQSDHDMRGVDSQGNVIPERHAAG
jgi:hypothetical protein